MDNQVHLAVSILEINRLLRIISGLVIGSCNEVAMLLTRELRALRPSHNPLPTICHHLPYSGSPPPHLPHGTCDMADHAGSTRFRARFESALQTYRQATGVTLAEHPLAVQLQSCHSIESITAILTREARASRDLSAGCDRIITSMKYTISMLFTLSTTASFGDAIDLVRKG